MKQENANSFYTKDDESIDLVNLLNKIWKNRFQIFRIIIIFFVLGCIFSLITPVLYQSHTTFVPQTSDENSSSTNKSLGNLASLAGINLNAETSSSIDNYISPLLYSKIIDSDEFSVSLLKEKIYLLDNTQTSVKEHLLNKRSNFSFSRILRKYTIDLFKKKKSTDSISDKFIDEFNFIDNDDFYLAQSFKKKFSIEANKKDGYIKVVAFDKDAFISAQIVKLVTKNLQNNIIKLRTNKIKEQLEYSKEQYLEKKEEFELLQLRLAEFRDSNKNISTAIFLSELQKLETEYSLQQNILISLATEFNNNKIKLNKDTPIFSVLDEVSVPIERYQPKRTFIVIIFIFIGILASILHTLFYSQLIILFKEIQRE